MDQVFDRQLAVQRANGSEELADELQQMLLDSLPQHKAEIEVAWSSGDMAEVTRLVHKLNGSTRYCGTPQLEHCADTLEGSLKSNSDDVSEQYQALIQALNNLLSQ